MSGSLPVRGGGRDLARPVGDGLPTGLPAPKETGEASATAWAGRVCAKARGAGWVTCMGCSADTKGFMALATSTKPRVPAT